MTTLSELKTALGKLGAVSTQDLMAVEILWSPQDGNDFLTEDELLTGVHDMLALECMHPVSSLQT